MYYKKNGPLCSATIKSKVIVKYNRVNFQRIILLKFIFRTQLPVKSNCTAIDSGAGGKKIIISSLKRELKIYLNGILTYFLGWPFPDYSWLTPGQPGETVSQKCPEGQKGDAKFECGIDGQWVGYPGNINKVIPC